MSQITLYSDGGQPLKPEEAAQVGNWGAGDQRDALKIMTAVDYGLREMTPFWMRQAETMDFKNDRPWNGKELAYFASQRRVPVSVNIMRPAIMHVSGLQRSSRSEIKVDPVDNVADPAVATMASDLVNGSDYESQIAIVESIVFNDGLCGIGNYHVSESISDSIPSIISERDEPYQVIYDPDYVNPLMKDCRWKARLFYFRSDEIKRRFPKARNVAFNDDEGKDWWKSLNTTKSPLTYVKSRLQDRSNDTWLVIEMTERVKSVKYVMLDGDTGMNYGEFKGGADEAQMIRAINPAAVFKYVEEESFVKTTLLPYCYTILDKVEEPYRYWDNIPFLSLRDGQRIPQCSSYNYGMVGLQREKNVRRSKLLEAVMRSVSGQFWIQRTSGSKTLLTQLNADGWKLGQSYEYDGVLPAPIFSSEGIQYIHMLEQGSLDDFQNYTGKSVVPVANSGYSGEAASHLRQVIEQQQMLLYPILDDHDQARVLRAHAVLERRIAQLDIPQAIRVASRNQSDPAFINITREVIDQLKGSYGKGLQFSGIRVENGPFVTTQKRIEQDQRRADIEFATKTWGAEVVTPGTFLRGCDLPDAPEMADQADKIWVEKMGGVQPSASPVNDISGGQPLPLQGTARNAPSIGQPA